MRFHVQRQTVIANTRQPVTAPRIWCARRRQRFALAVICCTLVFSEGLSAAEPESLPKACIDGTGPGWRELTLDDFETVNCDPETWTMQGGMIHCTGTPIGVTRTKEKFTNLELVAQWRHQESGGNSGIFLWAPIEVLTDLPRDKLPGAGIEVQMLDHGYKEKYIERTGKSGPFFFSTNGDIFPVGRSTMKPFPPLSPNGARSFPSKELSKGHGEWNHYYVRAINGEVRLWVNGEEVSGGTNCNPASGHLCLESEGAPIDFRHIRIRVLP